MKDADRALTSDHFHQSPHGHHCQCLLQPDTSPPTTKTNSPKFDSCVGLGWILLKSQTDVLRFCAIAIRNRANPYVGVISFQMSQSMVFLLNISTRQQSATRLSASISLFHLHYSLSTKTKSYFKLKIWGIAAMFSEEEYGVPIKDKWNQTEKNWKQIHCEWQKRRGKPININGTQWGLAFTVIVKIQTDTFLIETKMTT